MNDPVTVALVGIGGYGGFYLKTLLESEERKKIRLVGVVDCSPERSDLLGELETRQIPVFRSLEKFYEFSHAELLIISTPIHLHCPQTCLAVAKGSHVLCEKPVSATIQDARRMLDAQKQAGKIVAIGYHWSFSDAVLNLKRDIMAGRFGKPRRLRTLVLWPRNEKYYNRSSWAGKQRASSGEWVLDSPANNATAHYLHNMFYLLGSSLDKSAFPAYVTAELYRANRIENFDTAAMRCFTDSGVEILFFTSHATHETTGPIFSFEFENATIRYDRKEDNITATFDNGSTMNYDSPDAQREKKVWDIVESIRNGTPVVCGIEAALPHTLCINGMQESMPDIVDFPESIIKIEEEEASRTIVVDGLDEALMQCYTEGVLPAETNAFPWAKSGKKIDLMNYKKYPR